MKKLIPIIACLYVALVIVVPALNVVAGAFAKGLGPFIENFNSEELRHAV
ncbi:MAG: sulfate ABC transporter permease subunit CysW, partial [Synechococcaceae bacterium WB6_3B_236]|nr:sulfate ABC transporter permease subunit CysW [Synechococcaceae bacterium WB6_3B_236]